MLKVEVLGSERLGISEVTFRVRVLKSVDDGVTWVEVMGAPDNLVVSAAEILAITNDEGLTDNQKKVALLQLMQTQVEGYGVTEAEEAIDDLAALAIAYPVTINL